MINLIILRLGVEFKGDEVTTTSENRTLRRVVYVKKNDHHQECEEKTYEILHVLDFDSRRGRMSVIVRDLQRNEIVLYCKGSDASILNKLLMDSSKKKDQTSSSFIGLNYLSDFESGQRVLAFAYKILDANEYRKCSHLIEKAQTSVKIVDRLGLLAFEAIETNLTMLGVTTAEESLQEDVESTLISLHQAGVKVWVLSGDRMDTCVNILESCGYFSSQSSHGRKVRFLLQDLSDQESIRIKLSSIQDE
jgi:magnesium-transporting ATPase (P-type)